MLAVTAGPLVFRFHRSLIEVIVVMALLGIGYPLAVVTIVTGGTRSRHQLSAKRRYETADSPRKKIATPASDDSTQGREQPRLDVGADSRISAIR